MEQELEETKGTTAASLGERCRLRNQVGHLPVVCLPGRRIPQPRPSTTGLATAHLSILQPQYRLKDAGQGGPFQIKAPPED